jgi:hypothetical protein
VISLFWRVLKDCLLERELCVGTGLVPVLISFSTVPSRFAHGITQSKLCYSKFPRSRATYLAFVKYGCVQSYEYGKAINRVVNMKG